MLYSRRNLYIHLYNENKEDISYPQKRKRQNNSHHTKSRGVKKKIRMKPLLGSENMCSSVADYIYLFPYLVKVSQQ